MIPARHIREGDVFRYAVPIGMGQEIWSPWITAKEDATYYDETYTVTDTDGEPHSFTYDDMIEIRTGGNGSEIYTPEVAG